MALLEETEAGETPPASSARLSSPASSGTPELTLAEHLGANFGSDPATSPPLLYSPLRLPDLRGLFTIRVLPKVLFAIDRLEARQSPSEIIPEFPDLAHVRAEYHEPEQVQVTLEARPDFDHRNRREWIDACWPSIRERVLDALRRSGAPEYDLRRSEIPLPSMLEWLRPTLVGFGGIKARICEISVTFESESQTIVCVDVVGRTSRYERMMRDLESRARAKYGHKFEIFAHTTDLETVLTRAMVQLLKRPDIKRPRLLGERDDPKAKFLRRPIDLRNLKWWGMDSPDTIRPEDVNAVVRTRYGDFALVAIPMTIFENKFRRDRGTVALFVSGRVSASGEMDRLRVGYGVIAAPKLVVANQPISTELQGQLEQHKKNLSHVFLKAPQLVGKKGEKLRVRYNGVLPEQRLAQISIRFLQRALRETTKITSAPFIVRPDYNASGPVVLRGFEIGKSGTIPLKASDAGGKLNQLQLYRVLSGQAPLSARRMQRYLRLIAQQKKES